MLESYLTPKSSTRTDLAIVDNAVASLFRLVRWESGMVMVVAFASAALGGGVVETEQVMSEPVRIMMHPALQQLAGCVYCGAEARDTACVVAVRFRWR
jgi:hypothetical protein